MNIEKHKKKKPDWRHGKVAKLLLYFILETYEYIQDTDFTKGIILDERPLTQILIEETSKNTIGHYSLIAKKTILGKRHSLLKDKKQEKKLYEERNVKLIYFSLLKFKGFIRYMTYQEISFRDIRNASCYLKHNFYKEGTYIMRKHDKSTALYGIITGKISIREINFIDKYKQFYFDNIRGNDIDEDLRNLDNIDYEIFMSDLEEENELDDDYIIFSDGDKNYSSNNDYNNELINNNQNNKIESIENKIDFKKIRVNKRRATFEIKRKIILSPLRKKKLNKVKSNELLKSKIQNLKSLSKKNKYQKSSVVTQRNNKYNLSKINSRLFLKKLTLKSKKNINLMKKKKKNKIIKSIKKYQTPEDLKDNVTTLKNFILDFENERITLSEGLCFGEWGLIYNIPRTTSIYCLKDTNIFYLEKKYFDQLLYQKFSKADIKKVHFILNKFPFLKKDLKFKYLLTKITPVFFDNGDIVYTPFDDAKIIYLLYRGEASLCKLNINVQNKEEYLNKKNDLKVIIDFIEGGICGLEAGQEIKKYEYCLLVKKDFTIFLRINVDFMNKKYSTFKDSIKDLYINYKNVIEHFKHKKKILEQSSSDKNKNKINLSDEFQMRRSFSNFQKRKNNLSNIMTVTNNIWERNFNSNNKKLKKNKPKISLKYNLKNFPFSNRNSIKKLSNNFSERLFLTTTNNNSNYNSHIYNTNHQSKIIKSENFSSFDDNDLIMPIIKDKNEKEKEKDIKKNLNKNMNKNEILKQLGLPYPFKSIKIIKGKNYFNTGKYEIPLLTNVKI